MSDNTVTPRAQIPLSATSESQKPVTVDQALFQLDALLFARFLDRDLSTPPGSPAEGDTYLVAATATDDWEGRDGDIAFFAGGAWKFYVPYCGLSAFVVDETVLVVFNGTSWVDYASVLALQNIPLVGVNTTADSTNKLAVKSSAVLFDNIGNGVQFKVNKHATADTASVLYQTNYSGRAEVGLTGDDNFHFKVSPDGSTFYDGLTIRNSDGGIDLLAGETSLPSAATTDLGTATSLKAVITGTTTITSFGTTANKLRFVRFAGALTLTHNSTSLILPNGINIVTAAGDTLIATSDSSGNWRVRSYARANGALPLTADTTFYVRTDGSDSNTGLANSAGGAFLTIQKAVDTIASLDLGTAQATVQIGDGTYTGAVVLKPYRGSKSPIVQGNNSTPANVLVSTTSNHGFFNDNAGLWNIRDLKIQTTTSGDCLYAMNFGSIYFQNLDFGACAAWHLYSQANATIKATGNYAVSGGAVRHAAANGWIILSSRTITYSNTPNFSGSNVLAGRGGVLECISMSFVNGATVTGQRYLAGDNGVIFTGTSGSATYIPGSTTGSATTGGQYD